MFNFPCRRPTFTEVITVMNIARITVVFVAILVLTCEVQSISGRRTLDAPMLKVLRNIKEILGVPCPQGWVRFKDYCYHIGTVIKT
ncbi:unnamed protein product [Porites lobata]|uniref:Uncharacterized protein n=1 Tax=Porites lobata TaxID=104759 RepID=A0ABN8RK55_9CNID|nr:unnamed protein product [Porites lobata]